MRRYIPLVELIFFLSIILITVAATLAVFLTPQEWPIEKIIVLSIVPPAIVVMCVSFLLMRYFAKPAFITKQGVAVWTCSTGPLLSEIEDFLDFYIESVPEVWPQATKENITEMLRGAKIEFVTKLISIMGIGWAIKDAYGVQQGNTIKVKYNLCHLETTALCHELHHMMDELVFKVPPDYQHKLTVWWYTVGIINTSWAQRNGLQRRALNVQLPKAF